MYQSPNKAIWKGRNDPGQSHEDHLWHHVVNMLDLNAYDSKELKKCIALLGFSSDEGVRRNQGRTGAVEGPDVIRKALCNLAVHFNESQQEIVDAGNVITGQGKLEEAQKELGHKVALLLKAGAFPILLGGGHEIAYGHYCGIRDFLGAEAAIGIINFDAHFDLRSYDSGAHSGSPFRQIFDDTESRGYAFHYLPIGINESANTRRSYRVMQSANASYVPLEMVNGREIYEVKNQIQELINRVDWVYVTLDLDVISGVYAPGVSAPAAIGVVPNHITDLLQVALDTDKVISMDIAELNPQYDNGQTARLAANFIYQVVKSRFSLK